MFIKYSDAKIDKIYKKEENKEEIKEEKTNVEENGEDACSEEESEGKE
jgi:hypothetical protein